MMGFKNGNRVEFHSTGDIKLDNLKGAVIGIAFQDPIASHYIVLLDECYSDHPWDAIQITEHCLRKI